MKKMTLIAFSILFFVFTHAQKNLRESFIILNSKDTVKGFIDYREWYKNPSSILFSTSKEQSTQRYGAGEIISFTIIGKEAYQRHFIKISMDKQSLGNIGEKDTSSRTEMVFLKVLQHGKNLTLFSYEDETKPRLYVLTQNETTPVELQNSEYLLNGQLVSDNQYRTILFNIARKYLTQTEDIRTSLFTQDYSQEIISNICYRINGIAPALVQQEEKNKLSHLRFFAGIGINRGLVSFDGTNHYTGITNNASYQPVVNGGVDIFVNPSIGKMFLRSQLSVSRYTTSAYTFVQYYASKENYYLRFKQTNIGLHEQLNYNLYNGQYFKWFLGAGIGINLSSYPLNEEKLIRQDLTDTSTSINNKYVAFTRQFWLSPCFRSGVLIRNFEMAFAYYPKSSITLSSGYQVNNSSLQFQFNYLFK